MPTAQKLVFIIWLSNDHYLKLEYGINFILEEEEKKEILKFWKFQNVAHGLNCCGQWNKKNLNFRFYGGQWFKVIQRIPVLAWSLF